MANHDSLSNKGKNDHPAQGPHEAQSAGHTNAQASQTHEPVKQSSGFKQPKFWFWIALAVVILVADQLSKQYFDGHLYYAERWPVLPFFDFTLLYNPGAAFSFLAGAAGWQRWFFSAIALIATVLIIYWLQRQPKKNLFCTALSCILGGALGNVLDRVLHGYVIDFLLFHWQEWYFPAFNIADIAITIGAALLIIDEFLRVRQTKKKLAQKGGD